MDQMRVKNDPRNPLKLSLIVDVNVEKKHGEPKAYRVVRLHDILDD